MKKNTNSILLCVLACATSCNAVGFLNGTSSLVYSTINQVFHSGVASGAQGYVMLDGGFTVLPAAQAVFDIFTPVSGPIDLRDTGILTLVDDLNLGSNVTFSNGGLIDGRGHQLILGGNLMLPSNEILHFRSNTTIDGRGHTLTVGDYAQLFVDINVTLTLQNMVLKSGAKTSIFPPVRCAASNSRLVLDNVMLEPGSDFPFYQGQLYVYDDVLFSGTSALVYTSPQASFIASGATLAFDIATTFSFAPATASNQQIVMQDATSRIILDGCTLKCTDTGMRLTKGTVLCDNKVALDSWSGEYLSSLTTLTYGIYRAANTVASMRAGWCSDGNLFVVAGDQGVVARIYSLYGAGGQLGTTIARLSPIGTTVLFLTAWSPDRRFITIGASGYWATYSFNGVSFSSVVSGSYGNAIVSLDYSPDGRYLAFGEYNGGGCKIYLFNGVGYQQVASAGFSGNLWSIKWHPSGKYIALGGDAGLGVYRFNGSSLSQTAYKGVGTTIVDVKWSPDGQYLALGSLNANTADGNILAGDNLRIYSLNSVTGALLPVIGSLYGSGSGAGVYGLSWHPDGKILAAAGVGAASGGTNNPFNDTNLVRMYQFTGSSLNGLISYTLPSPLSTITYMWSCAWDPSGNYLLISGRNTSYVEYYGVLKANFVSQPNPQALLAQSPVFGGASNSFIFTAPSLLVSNALYGNPPTTDVTSFVNYNLLPKQGGSLAITARDEVITGTMSSFTYTATNFSPPDQLHTYFWNRGWPLFTKIANNNYGIVGIADTLWTKFHAIASRDLGVVLANVGSIDATSNIITTTMSYLVDIGGPTGTASFIAKGNREFGYTSTRYHANPAQILGGDDALLTSGGGDYWASFNRESKEISWGKGTIVGLDPKQTWTDAARFSGINRVGFCSSADVVISNISIGHGADLANYRSRANADCYYPYGGWELPGGVYDVKWVKYYATGVNDAYPWFTTDRNIDPTTLITTGSSAYGCIIAGWGNTASRIAKGRNTTSYTQISGADATTGLLPNQYWASIQRNNVTPATITISWGIGSVVGQNVVQTATDNGTVGGGVFLGINRVTFCSYNSPITFSNIQVGCGADPGTELVLNYPNNVVATLGLNQTLALTAPASQAFSNSLAFGNSSINYTSLTTTLTTGLYIKAGGTPGSLRCCWDPAGGSNYYFAVAGDFGYAARVYKVNGLNGKLGTTFGLLPLGYQFPYDVAWTLDGHYVVVGGAITGGPASGAFATYSFDGANFAKVGSTITYSGGWIRSVAWSADGAYLAIGINNNLGCYVYSFDGSSYTRIGNAPSIAYTGVPYGLRWYPTGHGYLAITGDAGIQIYSLVGTTLTQVATKTVGASVYGVDWSPNGKYIAIGAAAASTADGPIFGTDNVRVYSFDNGTGAITALTGRYYGTGVYGLGWHPSDNKTLAVVGNGAAAYSTSYMNNPFMDTNLVRLYQLNNGVLGGIVSYTVPSPLSAITYMWDCAWDPTGTYLGIVGYDASLNEYYGIIPASTLLSTSADNLKVKLLSGARVEVRGQVMDDSV